MRSSQKKGSSVHRGRDVFEEGKEGSCNGPTSDNTSQKLSLKTKIVQRMLQPTKERMVTSNLETERNEYTVTTWTPSGYDASVDSADLVYEEQWIQNAAHSLLLCDRALYVTQLKLSPVLQSCLIHATNLDRFLFNTNDVTYKRKLVSMEGTYSALL